MNSLKQSSIIPASGDDPPNTSIAVELYKSVIGFASHSINFFFLLNGAAIIAILSTIGEFKSDTQVVQQLASGSAFFISGVITAAFASVIGYLTQFTYYKEMIGHNRPFAISGTLLRILLLIVIISSAILFSIGSHLSIRAFL